MSAPDTNIEKQNKRHKPALLGIKGAMVFGALMLIAIVFYAVANDSEPSPGAVMQSPPIEQPALPELGSGAALPAGSASD